MALQSLSPIPKPKANGNSVKSKVNVFIELHRQGNLVRRQLQALERARREQDELLVQLQSARDELQRAVAMRDEFMSVVSQELRSPLHTLFLQAQMRKMHIPSGDSPSFAAAFTLSSLSGSSSHRAMLLSRRAMGFRRLPRWPVQGRVSSRLSSAKRATQRGAWRRASSR